MSYKYDNKLEDFRNINYCLKKNGYFLDRIKGGHFIYKNNRKKTIIIPRNSKSINRGLLKRIVKANNLRI